MFRFIVLFALAAGSIYAGPVQHEKLTFKKGFNVIYNYKFQHVFADPGFSNLYGIIDVESKAVLHAVEDDLVVLSLTNITIGPTETKLSYINPLLRMVTREIAPAVFNVKIDEIIKKLEIPIKFKHVDGTVLEIIKDVNEVPESLNIKRGLISFFEMNVLAIESVVKSPKSVHEKLSEPVYLEKTVQGLCKTKWLFPSVPQKTEKNHISMEVVKSIDTESCIVAPVVQRGLISSYRGGCCEPRVKMVESSSTVRYFITAKPTQWEVTKAISESIYQVLLNSPSEGRITLSLNQSITLVGTSKKPAPKLTAASSTGLIGELPVHKKSPFSADGVVEKLITMIEGDVQAKDVNDIILLAEYLDLTHLRTIWARTKDSRGYLVVDIFVKVDSPVMRVFLQDILPVLSKTYWAAISDIALFQSPDEKLLFSLLEILQTAGLSKEHRQHLILNIGAYANKFAVLLRKTEEEIKSGKSLVAEAIKDMESYNVKRKDMESIWNAELAAKSKLVANIKSWLEKVSMTLKNLISVEPVHSLKAMGNMGWEMNVQDLWSIIKNQASPLSWRIVAVDSLRKMPWLSIEKILEPLVSLYADEKESGEIRTKVFLLLTKFELSETTIMELLLTHQTESPEWVGPFVYKYLSSISKCKFWPMQKMSAKAEKIVTSLDPILPMYLKERMSIPNIYEVAHKLWRKMSSLLVWHFTWSNDKSFSSSAVDVQVIPGVVANETSIILRVRSSSLANYDDVAVEIMIPHKAEKLAEIILSRNWAALANTTISLKRNELELRSIKIAKSILSLSKAIEIPQILSLIWNVNSRRIPTASGGYLFVDQKSTVVGRLPWDQANKNLTVTSECHVNAYINGHFMHVGAGMKTAVKVYVPARLQAHLEADKIVCKVTWMPVEKTAKLISIEQVPYTVLRQFLPKFYEGGELVTVQEVPVVISKKATDVNYIEVTENLALHANLPMTARYPQDILTTVWYGIHSIHLVWKSEKIATKTLRVEVGGRVLKGNKNVTLVTEFGVDEWISKQNISISLVPESHNLVCKVNMIVQVAGEEHVLGADISIPLLKPLPAKCLFSAIYQNITRSLLHKVDLSQPCLMRSQVEQIAPKYIRIWKKLTSFGLLDIDEAQHNIIAELTPESISGNIKPTYLDDLRVQVETLKKIQDFNQAAFQPLTLEEAKAAAKEVHEALIKAHENIQKQTSPDASADLTYAAWYHAVVYELIAIHQVSIPIYKEALLKISALVGLENLNEPSVHESYIKLVKEFNNNFDSQIEKKIVSVNDRKLFEKILEVEALLVSGNTETWLIQTKTNELLTLIPQSFDPESKITEILFLRAHHIVSHSVVFLPPVKGVTLYEFWHLKQDIIMYSSLRQEFIAALPTDNTKMWRMNDLISKEFKLFHNALSYKRVALRAFLSGDSNLVNELMLEFDNLLFIIESAVHELKSITSEVSIDSHPSIETVKTLYRMTTASEWSMKLLEEDKLIWHHINEFSVASRADLLRKLQKNILVLWNNLKISESCKSQMLPLPATLPANWTSQECAIPESLNIIANLTVNSSVWLKAQVTAKKSFEQLIHEHDQSLPGFRAETTFRYLNKLLLNSGIPTESTILPAINSILQTLGLNITGIPEEWNIVRNINSFNDIQVDAVLIKPHPMVEELLSSPVWTKIVRLMRWPLLKYWQIEDWNTVAPKATPGVIRLPTIRVVRFMDKLMADILIVRPTVTESFLEVPVLTLPMIHLPKWVESVPAAVAPVSVPAVKSVEPTLASKVMNKNKVKIMA